MQIRRMRTPHEAGDGLEHRLLGLRFHERFIATHLLAFDHDLVCLD